MCVCVRLRGKEGVKKWYYSASRLLEAGKVWVVCLEETGQSANLREV